MTATLAPDAAKAERRALRAHERASHMLYGIIPGRRDMLTCACLHPKASGRTHRLHLVRLPGGSYGVACSCEWGMAHGTQEGEECSHVLGLIAGGYDDYLAAFADLTRSAVGLPAQAPVRTELEQRPRISEAKKRLDFD